MFFTVFLILLSVAFSALVFLVHSVKSLSTMLDRRNAMSASNEEFLADFRFRLKLNRFFERTWPRIKYVGSGSVERSVYKLSMFGFVSIIVICYAFPSVVTVTGPFLLIVLGIFSIVGNALKPSAKSDRFGKMILVPVCAIIPLALAYQVDTNESAVRFKALISALSVSYSAALMLGVFICFIGSVLFILILEKFQTAVVRVLISRTLLMAKRLALLGIITTEPDEVEARAMAKDAVTATLAYLSFVGVLVGGGVALVKVALSI